MAGTNDNFIRRKFLLVANELEQDEYPGPENQELKQWFPD